MAFLQFIFLSSVYEEGKNDRALRQLLLNKFEKRGVMSYLENDHFMETVSVDDTVGEAERKLKLNRRRDEKDNG